MGDYADGCIRAYVQIIQPEHFIVTKLWNVRRLGYLAESYRAPANFGYHKEIVCEKPARE